MARYYGVPKTQIFTSTRGKGVKTPGKVLARIMHRFLSRSDESADLTRRATEAPANVLYGTLRRPTECNAGRADDFVGAVENLCIVRATPCMYARTQGHDACYHC